MNVNHKDKVKETPLFYAAREGKVECCRLLLNNGADVNVVDDRKQTALYFAKKFNHEKVINLLIEYGAFNTKDGRLTKNHIKKLNKIRSQKQSSIDASVKTPGTRRPKKE